MSIGLTKTMLPPAAVLASLPAQTQAAADRPDLWYHGSSWGWGHMVFGSVMMLLVWGVIIVGIVMLVRWLNSSQGHATTPESPKNRPLEILQERFARGEIDKEEFEERKRVLLD